MEFFIYKDMLFLRVHPRPALMRSTTIKETVDRGDVFAVRLANSALTIVPGHEFHKGAHHVSITKSLMLYLSKLAKFIAGMGHRVEKRFVQEATVITPYVELQADDYYTSVFHYLDVGESVTLEVPTIYQNDERQNTEFRRLIVKIGNRVRGKDTCKPLQKFTTSFSNDKKKLVIKLIK